MFAGELERSLVMEYQQRLARKRQEVAHLQKQKDNLVEMQEKILAMQEKYLVGEVCTCHACVHALHGCGRCNR